MYYKKIIVNLTNSVSSIGDESSGAPIGGVQGIVKALFDVGFSVVALVALLPVLIIISVLIKLDTRGPVLFKQDRTGLDGKEISVWKFRTMTVLENGAELKQATRGDSRVTMVGKFLRKTSLDELPQFFNVLQGSMSVVGPRPHAIAHDAQFRHEIPNYDLRYMVKPGITGWAQINGARGETDTIEKMEKRIELDLEYIKTWNLYRDIHIVFLTVVRGFCDKNAY